jgi:hypothetical protein
VPLIRRSADGGRDGCQPALSPVRNRGQHRLEGSAARSEPIANADRRAWIHETLNKPLGLQLAKPLCEDAVTDAGDTGKKLIESSRRWNQCLNDRPGPALTYQLNGALKGRAVVEAPTDHGERFYSLSVVSEATRSLLFRRFPRMHASPSLPEGAGMEAGRLGIACSKAASRRRGLLRGAATVEKR